MTNQYAGYFSLFYFAPNPKLDISPVITDIGINPQFVWPTCKSMPEMGVIGINPGLVIYAKADDVAEATQWLYGYMQKQFELQLAALPNIEASLRRALERLPKPAPKVESEMLTLWIVPELVAAIVNCDFTGISDADEVAIHRFMEKYNHIMLPESPQSKWCKCEVTKLDSVCIPVYFDPKMSAKIKELAA